MDEPNYPFPVVDANGLPLGPPVTGRRRDPLAPPPPSARRADNSMFAPPEPFSMTTPVPPSEPTAAPTSWQTPIERPVYDVPLFADQARPVHDIPPYTPSFADAPPPTTPAFPIAPPPVYDIPATPAPRAAPESPAPVYEIPPSFAEAAKVPPPVFEVPTYEAPAYDAPAQEAPAFDTPASEKSGSAQGFDPTAYAPPTYIAPEPLPTVFDVAPPASAPLSPFLAGEPPASIVDARPVYDVPTTAAPAGVYDVPSYSSTDDESEHGAASQVYDLSSDAVQPAMPKPAPLMPQEAPEAARFPAPIDEPLSAVGEVGPKGDLLGALREVLYRGASDLHISAGAPPMLRIDGALGPLGDGTPWSRETVRSTLLALLSPYERERFDSTLELDFAYTLTANARFRVNYYQDRGAMSAAFRIIPNEVKQLAELGIPDAVASFATLPRGLVLVTGPTGSGKSTTLAALIDIVNSTRTDHIMTVEDPIEFLHRNKKALVHQREVGRDTHSFGSALKHVLRQDPNVILIGELRDLETISTALTAAETGHLVFATLHTQDAAQTIDRIIDVYPPHQQMQIRSQLASTLQGIVCQTLVKRASGAGRVVAAEVLMMTPAIGNLIREGKTFQIGSAMQAGRALGMSTLDQHLADLVNTGAITRQSAIDKARDIASMTRMITRVDVSDQSDGSFGSFAAPTKGSH